MQHIPFLDKGKTSKASVLLDVSDDKLLSMDNFWPYKLKGGADSNQVEIEKNLSIFQNSTSIMVNMALENAKYHSINLYHGVPNMADGNCAFESIIDNISTRSCFEEKFDGTPDHWRFIWMSVIENIGYNDWNGGISAERWKEQFKILKSS